MDSCIYCQRKFGSTVTWKGKIVFLQKIKEHIIPKAAGGTEIVPGCQICNQIKGSLIFGSLAEIQNFCLDALLKDGSLTLHTDGRIQLIGEEPIKPSVGVKTIFIAVPEPKNWSPVFVRNRRGLLVKRRPGLGRPLAERAAKG